MRDPGASHERFKTAAARRELIAGLVRFELLAQAAERAGLTRDPDAIHAQRQIAVTKLVNQTLGAAASLNSITDDEIARAYATRVATDFTLPPAVHVRHIRVKGPDLARGSRLKRGTYRRAMRAPLPRSPLMSPRTSRRAPREAISASSTAERKSRPRSSPPRWRCARPATWRGPSRRKRVTRSCASSSAGPRPSAPWPRSPNKFGSSSTKSAAARLWSPSLTAFARRRRSRWWQRRRRPSEAELLGALSQKPPAFGQASPRPSFRKVGRRAPAIFPRRSARLRPV